MTFLYKESIINISIRSNQSCHQHKLSPISVTNIDEADTRMVHSRVLIGVNQLLSSIIGLRLFLGIGVREPNHLVVINISMNQV